VRGLAGGTSGGLGNSGAMVALESTILESSCLWGS